MPKSELHGSTSLQGAVDGGSAKGGSFGSFSLRGPARRGGPKEQRHQFASFAKPPVRASLGRALGRGGLRSARSSVGSSRRAEGAPCPCPSGPAPPRQPCFLS